MLLLALRSPRLLSPQVAGFFFETQWTWWLAAAALGGVLVYIAAMRANLRMLRAGQVILAATALWVPMALLVESPAERLYAAHVDLAAAVEKSDMDRIFSHFDSGFSVPQLAIAGEDLAAAKDQLADILKEYGIKESKITNFHTTLNADSTAVTHLTVITLSGFGPIKSAWRLSWNDQPDSDWKIHHATMLKLGDQDFPSSGQIR